MTTPTPDDFAMKVWREALAAPEPLGTLSLGRKRDEWATRVLSEAFDKVRAEGVEQGRAEERARIVAWLRTYATMLVRSQERALLSAADTIEQGSHDNG